MKELRNRSNPLTITLLVLICIIGTTLVTKHHEKEAVRQAKIDTLLSIRNDPSTFSSDNDWAIGCHLVLLDDYSDEYLVGKCLKVAANSMFTRDRLISAWFDVQEYGYKSSNILLKITQKAPALKPALVTTLKKIDMTSAICDAAEGSPNEFESIHEAMNTAKYLMGKTEFRKKINENSDGVTALHCAAAEGNASLTNYLLVWGANPKAKNDEGETPLESARYWNEKETARILAGK